MNIERLLVFIFNNNILLIEILFAVSLLGILLLAFRFFTSKDEAGGSAPDWNRLEENIKRILENASTTGGKSAALGSGSSFEIPEGMSESAVVRELQTQLERAQLQLMQKEEEVKKLNNAVGTTDVSAKTAASGQATSAEEVAVFEEKIKDLESRLNEYSIIEDDIADLSFFKEETVRLQTEVDKLNAELAALKDAEGAAPVMVAVAPVKPAVTPTAVAAAPPVVAESASELAVAPEVIVPEIEIPPAVIPDPVLPEVALADLMPATPAATEGADFIDNDIMAEFERAVAEQKAVSAAAKNAKAEVKAEKAEAKAAEVKKTQTTVESIPEPTNIANIPSSTTPSSTTAEAVDIEQMSEGDINIDKMLNEAQDLSVADDGPDVLNAIDSTLDTDKLLKEATGMSNIDSEALAEFSDFVKKEGA